MNTAATRLKAFATAAAAILAAALAVSCGEDEPEVQPTQQTILVYMPWSGTETSVGLYRAFLANLDSIEAGIKGKKGLEGQRLMLFISDSHSSSTLYELTYTANGLDRTEVASYEGNAYTTAEGISEIISTVKQHAPALNYAMLIGCHGTGWTKKDTWRNYPYYAKPAAAMQVWDEDYTPTRFYGSVADMRYATEITDLAEGIERTGTKMQYILFDDCYMANVETAYALRRATNFLIASTSEIIDIGMPYASMWKSIAKPAPDYAGAVTAFGSFYSSYKIPSGTLSAIDCRQTEALAKLMKEANARYSLPDGMADSVQVLDGFTQPIFYDMADYADKLCPAGELKDSITAQIARTVRAKTATPTVYSALFYKPKYITVSSFSGLTISDPTTHPAAATGVALTEWYRDTH